jgi:hypothetical protein
LRPSQLNSLGDPISKVTKVKMDWRCGSGQSSCFASMKQTLGSNPTQKNKNINEILFWEKGRGAGD